ncbi:hypothetical protein LJC07_01770 [Christensenellaceae bacterium OttesenSCG-928-L17]|nr:hypothetical protein [Christensenellaceae bacterium OttesenSCG-928-L17]
MASKLEKKDINLLPLIRKKKELSAASKRSRAMLVILGLLLLVLAGLFAGYMVKMNQIDESKQELEAYLMDASVVAAYAQAVEAREVTVQAQNQAVALSNLFAVLNRMPTLSGSEFERIESLCGATLVIDDIVANMENRQLDIKLLGLHPEDISPFVAQLRASGLVQSVSYNGYSSQNATYYYFSVSCFLKEVTVSE